MERYEPFGLITEQIARKKIAECFPNTATLYAVLDYAVCFGTYNQGSFSLGIEAQTEPAALDWTYLRELRVFDEEQELYRHGYRQRNRRSFRTSELHLCRLQSRKFPDYH